MIRIGVVVVAAALLAGALVPACDAGNGGGADSPGRSRDGGQGDDAPDAGGAPIDGHCAGRTPACLPECPETGTLESGAPCERGVVVPADCSCRPFGAECRVAADCGQDRRRRCVAGLCECPAPAEPCLLDCESPAAGVCRRGLWNTQTCTCDAPAADAARLVGIDVRPAELRVEVGATKRLAATGRFSDSTVADVTASVTWTSFAPAIASIDAAGAVTGVAEGSAAVRARSGDVLSVAVPVTVRPAGAPDDGGDDDPTDGGTGAPDGGTTGPGGGEVRGVWVTRWNWSTAADVRTVLGRVADAGFTDVFFQVRGTADAYYRSTVEPWAQRLTGTLGRDPGWDPLAVALETARGRGVRLHAWINTMPCWSGDETPPASTPVHVCRAHPEWRQVDGSGTPVGRGGDYYALAPAIPGVVDHIASVARDIVATYEVDGLHLDYIRYAGRAYSQDAISRGRFDDARRTRPSLTYEDFQREAVDALVARVYEEVTDARPSAALTAAVWGIYENRWGWSGTSQGRLDYFQDPRAWVRAGTIDAIVPMIYWPLTDPPGGRLDFRTLLADHIAGAAGRFVFAGYHADQEFAEIADEIEAARALGAPGHVAFAYPYLADRDLFDDYAAGPFAEPTTEPEMPWKTP